MAQGGGQVSACCRYRQTLERSITQLQAKNLLFQLGDTFVAQFLQDILCTTSRPVCGCAEDFIHAARAETNGIESDSLIANVCQSFGYLVTLGRVRHEGRQLGRWQLDASYHVMMSHAKLLADQIFHITFGAIDLA